MAALSSLLGVLPVRLMVSPADEAKLAADSLRSAAGDLVTDLLCQRSEGARLPGAHAAHFTDTDRARKEIERLTQT